MTTELCLAVAQPGFCTVPVPALNLAPGQKGQFIYFFTA